MFENEECWVLTGGIWHRHWYGRCRGYTMGQPATVEFDDEWVWNNRQSVIGWIHTHPHWTAHPSSTDHMTMKAQVFALGKPLLCAIIGLDGLKAWWYLDDESDPVEMKIRQIGSRRLFGKTPRFPVKKVKVLNGSN